jgi:hypothetical protein
MDVQIWHIMAFAVIFCTVIFQVIRFQKDDLIWVRVLMLAKEGFFMIHVILLMNGVTSGIFFVLGLACLLFIYVRGLIQYK